MKYYLYEIPFILCAEHRVTPTTLSNRFSNFQILCHFFFLLSILILIFSKCERFLNNFNNPFEMLYSGQGDLVEHV